MNKDGPPLALLPCNIQLAGNKEKGGNEKPLILAEVGMRGRGRRRRGQVALMAEVRVGADTRSDGY